MPDQNELARFVIENVEKAEKLEPSIEKYPEVYVDKECRCYCQTCNKYVELKKGERVPPCCGKLMEVLDD